jgi:hypothetical protein
MNCDVDDINTALLSTSLLLSYAHTHVLASLFEIKRRA